MSSELEQYKKYVQSRLDGLRPIFAKAAVGDFSDNVQIPEEDDEFTEFYVGIQIMLDVIRDQLAELKKINLSLEEKVKQRTAELLSAQRMARMGNLAWDVQKNRIALSTELAKVYGVTDTGFESTYEDFLNFVVPADRSKVDTVLKGALITKTSFDLQYKISRQNDGNTPSLHMIGEVGVDAKGNPARIFGAVQDISEIVEAEERLKKRTEELERLNSFMVDRELRMSELKKKIENLEKKINHE